MDESDAGVMGMTSTANHELLQAFPGRIACHVPLASYTTLRIGGPAEFLLETDSIDDIIRARRICLQTGTPFLFLAGGSNVLIDDAGRRGLVVINHSSAVRWDDASMTAVVDSGYDLDTFVADVSARGWADLTFSAGIPGSLGGALVGGAGAFGHLVHEYLQDALVLFPDGDVRRVPEPELGIEYRTSKAKQEGWLLLEVTMGPFQPGEVSALQAEIRRIKDLRASKHPSWEMASAGSFFKNLPPETEGGHRVSAGKYLDECGTRGLQVGGAKVFDKHANIVVNTGTATAADINQLAEEMAERVRKRFGINLQREVQYVEPS